MVLIAREKLRPLKRLRIYRLLDVLRRALYLWRFHSQRIMLALRWIFLEPEDTNFTYDIEPLSRTYLASAISLATGSTTEAVLTLFAEAEQDIELRQVIREATETSRYRHLARAEPLFGRRLAWYAIARIVRPRVIIETGVDKGLGSILLCAALRRNAAIGSPGHYYGTDLNPEAGWLLSGPYAEFGTILYGDSLESLRAFAEPIDVFINDSDHSMAYEAAEYELVAAKLSKHAIIIGDNSHASDNLARFAEATGRAFLFISERSKGHWYPGAGVGLCFDPAAQNLVASTKLDKV